MAQAVVAGSEKSQKAQVSKDLQLLANFVADMAVGRMKPRQTRFEGVHLRQGELWPAERTNGVQHIECPAAPFKS